MDYGDNLEMKSGSYADVTLEAEKNSDSKYRTLKVTNNDSDTFFTEKALENAIEAGDFSLA